VRGRLIASERTSSTVTTVSRTFSIVGELALSDLEKGILATRGDREALQTAGYQGSFQGGRCRLEASPRLISWTEVEEAVSRKVEPAR